MHIIPTGKTSCKGSLEELRKKFNEEQDAKFIHCEESQEAGIASANADEQGKPKSIIPARRGRPKRAGRPNKGTTRKVRSN